MKQHFVIFFSPGTLFNEESSFPISSWDTDKAQEMAHGITERHGATPFAFCFTTRTRGKNDLDSHESHRSCKYYLGGEILTVEDIQNREANRKPAERSYDILLSNMRCNKWDRVIENKNSWTIMQPFEKDDILLDWKPRKRKAA